MHTKIWIFGMLPTFCIMLSVVVYFAILSDVPFSWNQNCRLNPHLLQKAALLKYFLLGLEVQLLDHNLWQRRWPQITLLLRYMMFCTWLGLYWWWFCSFFNCLHWKYRCDCSKFSYTCIFLPSYIHSYSMREIWNEIYYTCRRSFFPCFAFSWCPPPPNFV